MSKRRRYINRMLDQRKNAEPVRDWESVDEDLDREAIESLKAALEAAREEAEQAKQEALDAKADASKLATPATPDVNQLPDETQKRIAALEENVQDIRQLSELIAVKYNPFLEDHESDLVDGLANSPRQFVQPNPILPTRQMSKYALQLSPPSAPTPDAGRLPQPAPPAHQPEPEFETPTLAPHRQPPAFPELPAREVPRDEPQASARTGDGRSPRIRHGARESFLAMHWFTYMADGTDPSVIFLYLDYYKTMGSLDDASHQFLERLASGLATRKQGARWENYGLDLKRLANAHMRNLRFLDKLFGDTLQHGEADYLRQTADMLLSGDTWE